VTNMISVVQVVLIAVAVVALIVALSVDEGFWCGITAAFVDCSAAIIGTLGTSHR
jgi:ABC-type lipoprotein release transport system permease subunit